MKNISLAVCVAIGLLSACQKFEIPEMNIISDDDPAFSGPLQRFWAFENTATDSIFGARGKVTGVSFAPGISGQAYKGSATGFIEYASAGKLATMQSFTVSLWFNTNKHTGGAQCLFMLPNTEDFWGNLFVMIEGNDAAADNTMPIKFNFNGQWLEFTKKNAADGLNRWPDAYGKWKHVAFSYDGASSKVSIFVDGQKLALAESVASRTIKVSDTETKPLGPLAFKNVSRFVIGGFQQQIGIQGAPADWMLPYTGLLDQLRIYTTPLADNEILDLFNNKK